MCFSDLSKTLIYDFHYNYIKKKYDDNAKLLFTDTDSLTYEIEAEDIYRDFWNDRDKLDNSDYSESSAYFDKTDKKVIGKLYDEATGVPINEFIGLRSKMYSYIKDNQKGGKTAKGIKKNVIKNNIKHEDYKNTLFNNQQMRHRMKTIRSKNHKLGSYEINKVSLSCFDDKRYIHITSYTYIHYKIEENNEMTPIFPFIKYRHPYCGEDSFYQISVSILWRRYDFLCFYQISVSILWRRYDSSF